MAVSLISFPFHPYLLAMLLSVLLCTVLYARRLQKHTGKGIGSAFLALTLGLPFTVIASRLFYVIVQLPKVISRGFLKQLLSTEISLFSFTGGMLGVVFAVWLSARLCRLDGLKTLNLFAPVGALMACLARLCEYFLIDEQIGLGGEILNQGMQFFPLAVCLPEWGEYYASVFLLEALCCLAVAVLSWKVFQKNCLIRTLFALCLPQIFCQSLLKDNLMWWFFLKIEQLFCVLVCVGIVIYHSVRYRKGHVPICMAAVSVVIIAFCEYALDKITMIPSEITYAIMGAALLLMGLAEVFAYDAGPRD